MTWRERDHPRDGEGKFRDKDEWVRRISGAIGGFGDRAYGQHLLTDDLSFDELNREASQLDFGTAGLDVQLAAVYRRQGFDGPPTLVSPDQFDALVAQGEIAPLYRGVKSPTRYDESSGKWVPGEGPTAGQMHEMLRIGPTHWAGLGGYGNGTYFTPDQLFAESYSDNYPSQDSLLRAALRPDARVTTRKELEQLYFETYSYQGRSNRLQDRLMQELTDDPSNAQVIVEAHKERSTALRATYDEYRETFIGDLGRMAALLGYDAYWAAPDMSGEHRELIVLNRTALIVDAAPATPRWVTTEQRYEQRMRERGAQ